MRLWVAVSSFAVLLVLTFAAFWLGVKAGNALSGGQVSPYKSEQKFQQYDKKVRLVANLPVNLSAYQSCKKLGKEMLTQATSPIEKHQALRFETECGRYALKLDVVLMSLENYFSLDIDAKQSVNSILNRKNSFELDQQSQHTVNELISHLKNILKQQRKKLAAY